ncbi:nephrin-like [Panulirus ornatus]|uniref:nephrin-like n=1 Tax=Panulirus ornatus TaxID=150431 RepID=UPI003A889A13
MTSPACRMTSRTKTIGWLTLVILALTGRASGTPQEQQRFSVRPESVEVVEGSDVFLSCVVEHQQGKAQWTKDGFALGFEREVPGYPRYTYAGEPELGEHHLVISGVTLTEDGEYQCQVGPTDTSPPLWAAANVTVLLAPTGISLVGWGEGSVVEVTEGTTLNLECLVTEARPPPAAAWYRAGLRLDPGVQVDRVEASSVPRRWSLRSQVELTAEAADDGRLFSCQALHPTLATAQEPLTASITLSVLRIPEGPPRGIRCQRRTPSLGAKVTRSEDELDYIPVRQHDLREQDYPPATVTISGPAQVGIGETLNLTCETSDSNPPASLTWTLQGEVMETSKSVVGRDGSGGWVTSSTLTYYTVRSANVTEVKVECRALNPAVEEVVTKVTTVTIISKFTRSQCDPSVIPCTRSQYDPSVIPYTRSQCDPSVTPCTRSQWPAGRPVFESDLRDEVIAGTNLDLTCLSIGGHPPPSVRSQGPESGVRGPGSGVRGPSRESGARVRDPGQESGVWVRSQGPGSGVWARGQGPWSEVGGPESEVRGPGQESEAPDQESGAPGQKSGTLSQELGGPHGVSLPRVYKDGEELATEGVQDGGLTRARVEVEVTPADNGAEVSCEVTNPASKTPLSLSLSLITCLVSSLSLPPTTDSPLWVVQPPEQLDVYEGAQLVVTATAAANPGPLRYWWRRGEATLEASGGELRLGRVSRSHSGNYSVNAYNPRGAVNASFFLNVQYGPEKVESAERVTVGEGGAATVECSASANPSPTLTWTRATHNSTAQTLSSGVSLARLVIESATWADTGVYLCHASNIVSSAPPVKTKVIVTQAPTVAKEIAGASGTWASVGGDGRLVCRVRAAPAPSFVWTTQDGLALQNSEKYAIHEPQVVDGLVLWASVLEVRKVEDPDYARYTCTAHNALGSDSTTLALNPPARPHPPSNFSVTNVSISSVSLTWTPNFEGGLPRGYTIRYRPAGSLDYQFVDISGGNTAGTTLAGLTSGAEYFFSIQARNDQGRSTYLSPPLLVTLLGVSAGSEGVSDGSGRWQAPRLILLIMTLTGAALLVLNVAIIACFVRRRSRARRASGSSSTKPVALDTYCGTPDSTPGPHHSEGFLSLTARASNNLSNSPSPYKLLPICQQEEQQTSIDRCERPSTGSSSMVEVRPNITLLQNGTLARKNSTSSTQNGGVITHNPSFNIQSGGPLRQNGGIPSQLQQGNRGSSPCATPLNGRIPNQGKVHPPNNPEVCSLTGTCDPQPPHHHHQHQHHQRRDSGSLPADDQVSLSSYQSNHSRTYSQGYVRPLPPPGCPHHPPLRQQIQPLYQSHPYHQQQNEQQARHHHHGPPTYSSLNPSGLYNLSSEYFDSRCNQSSFSTGTPAGYATLGPRSRRATSSQFATLQRPQPSRPHVLNHSQISGHECSFPPRCQSDCCQLVQKNDEDERHSISACQVNHGLNEAEHHNHPRRSSFHGPLRRDSQRYDVVVPLPHARLTLQQQQDSGAPGHTTTQHQNSRSPESGTSQLQDNESQGYSTVKHQENESPGYSVPEQGGSGRQGYGLPQQEDGKVPEKNSAHQQDWGSKSSGHHSQSQSHNLSSGSTFTSQSNLTKHDSAQNSSSTSPPHGKDSSLRRDFSFRSNSSHKDAGISGRPRFPHDYVRQGSTKGKGRGPREGGDAIHNADKSCK